LACPGGCHTGAGLITPPAIDGEKPTKSDRKDRVDALERLLHSGDGVAVVPPIDHPLIPRLYNYIASRAPIAKPDSSTPAKQCELAELIGGVAVRSFLGAAWKSLKVDSEGNEIVGSSALKW